MRVEVFISFGGAKFYVPECSAAVAKRALMVLLQSSGAMPYWVLAHALDRIDAGVRRCDDCVIEHQRIHGAEIMVRFVNSANQIASILKARAGVKA